MEFPSRPMDPPMSGVFFIMHFLGSFFFEFLLLVLWLHAPRNLYIFPTGFLFLYFRSCSKTSTVLSSSDSSSLLLELSMSVDMLLLLM